MPIGNTSVDFLGIKENYLEFGDQDESNRPSGYTQIFTWALYDIPYNPGSAQEAIGEEQTSILDRLLYLAGEIRVEILKVSAHSSAEGSSTDNLTLSEYRADAVIAYIYDLIESPQGNNSNLSYSPYFKRKASGEDSPEIFLKDEDHPLNRRVEITFSLLVENNIRHNVGAITSKNWRVGFDQSFSFYKIVGAQFGFSSIEMLDEYGKSRAEIIKKKYLYVAAGFGVDIGLSVNKLRGLSNKNKLQKEILAMDKKANDVKNIASKLFDNSKVNKITDNINKNWSELTNKPGLRDLIMSSQGVPDRAQKITQHILEGLGFGVISTTIGDLDGKFSTEQARSISEIARSYQILLQIGLSASFVMGASIQITGVLVRIPSSATYDSEIVGTAILWTGLELGLPGAKAEASINLSHFPYILPGED